MAAKTGRPDVCGRMYHGAQFDVCKLSPRHEGDHQGRHTDIRYRDVEHNRTESTVTGLGDKTLEQAEEPNLFKGQVEAA